MARVSNFDDLQAALTNGTTEIILTRGIVATHSFVLADGVSLTGEAQENGELPTLAFMFSDGVGLTARNTVRDLIIQTSADRQAIFGAFSKGDIGTFTFRNLTLTGQFSFIMRVGATNAVVEMDHVDVIAADARNYLEQPQKYGVNVLQGAITVYNFNSNPDSVLHLTATNLSAGRPHAPVSGSGIFVAGFGDSGGKTVVDKLHTTTVYAHGRLPLGVADFITGGVFILNGAHAKEVIHDGETITYGVNDMVLDTLGEVDSWIVNAPVTSYGPSGIGFVNFGTVGVFDASKADVTTYGQGARGYNQYDGTVGEIRFKSVTTYGNGSIGIQISKPIGALTVLENVATYGSVGMSLVKGVNMVLAADALSIKEGGVAEQITIGGNLETYGDGVVTYMVDGGQVDAIEIKGAVIAAGKNSQLAVVENGGVSPSITTKA